MHTWSMDSLVNSTTVFNTRRVTFSQECQSLHWKEIQRLVVVILNFLGDQITREWLNTENMIYDVINL